MCVAVTIDKTARLHVAGIHVVVYTLQLQGVYFDQLQSDAHLQEKISEIIDSVGRHDCGRHHKVGIPVWR